MTGRRLALALLAATLLFPAAAGAACTVGPLVVVLPVVFGDYDPSAPNDLTSNGSVTVSCVLGTLPDFTLLLSAGEGNSFAPRQMNSGSARLGYNLYTGADYGSIWGDGTAPSVTQSYGAAQALTAFTVYGRIPKGQFAVSGLYGDTVTVIVRY